MKSQNGKFSILAAAVALSFSWVSAAPAAETISLEGAHVGYSTTSEERIELLIQPIEGREGSYLGLMVMLDPKVVLYQIDPLSPGTYTMVPIQVTEDGEIGVPNDNPSLTLNLTARKDRSRVSFQILSANSGNDRGFKGPIRFRGEEDPDLGWIDLLPGKYRPEGNVTGSAEVLTYLEDGQASATFTLSDLNGNYLLRKKRGNGITGVYTLRAVQVRNTGAEIESYPRKIGVFIRRNGFWGMEDIFLLVDPEDDENILRLNRKQ